MNENTRIVVGEVRFSYLHVFEPKAMENGSAPKYSVSLIIPKGDKALVEKINAAINAAFKDGVTTKFNGTAPAKWRNPLRDGDEERPGDEAYADSYFLNASSKDAPGIVKVNPAGSPQYIPITDQKELYSGCFGYASINFFPFSNAGNKGVGCALNHVLKTREGDPLGGVGTSAETAFSELDVKPETPDLDEIV